MAGRSYLKTEPRTSDIESAISDGYDEIGELADEMESWKDGLEEKLSHTSKYEQVSEAFDTLNDNRDMPDVDADLFGESDTKVSYGETVNKSKRRGVSRSTRLDNAVAKLSAAVDGIETIINSLDEGEDAEPEEDRTDLEQQKTDLEDALANATGEAADKIQEQIDELQEKIDGLEDETNNDNEERKSGLEELRDAIQETIDNLDGAVEFPGMYG